MEPNDQQDDQALREALLSVSEPEGLHQRLLMRLKQEAAEASEPHRFDDSLDDSLDAAPQLGRIVEESQTGTLRRRQWMGWALALSLVGLAFGVYYWSRPASTEQLAQFALGQLDRLQSDAAIWRTDFTDDQLAELSVLDEQLRANVQPIGFQDQAGGMFAGECRVWKLYSLTTNKNFYVFDFRHAVQVQSLTRQLQAIKRNSGGWSLVAMRAGERLVVVLVEGALDSYLYQPQSA